MDVTQAGSGDLVNVSQNNVQEASVVVKQGTNGPTSNGTVNVYQQGGAVRAKVR